MDTRRRDELTTEILYRIIDATAIDRASSTEEFEKRRLDLFTILETTLPRAIAAYSSSGPKRACSHIRFWSNHRAPVRCAESARPFL
jgi:hypothetical protein